MAQVPLTFLGPGALVVDGLPLLKDLDGGVAAHTEPAGQRRLRGRVDLSDSNGRVVRLQSTGDFFIFWGKLLAMSTPRDHNSGKEKVNYTRGGFNPATHTKMGAWGPETSTVKRRDTT